jgi:hypothetical protein
LPRRSARPSLRAATDQSQNGSRQVLAVVSRMRKN